MGSIKLRDAENINSRTKALSVVLVVAMILSVLAICGFKSSAAGGEWIQEKDQRWWYKNSDGSYAKDEYIDGYWLNSEGWYDGTWNASWKQNSVGWWYQATAWYPADSWLKIDGKWYHFKKSGYMDSGRWIGTSYVGKDGAWIEGYTNPDGSVGGKNKVVVIDPGHSSVVASGTEPLGPGSSETKAKDSGGTSGVSTGLPEYKLTLQIAEKLKTELEARGYDVVLTRYDNNTPVSCKERAEVANNENADAYIRLHGDGSSSSSARGAMCICITSGNPYISSMYSECKRLSNSVLSEYTAATGFSSRGVWETDSMLGNNWSQVPTTLIEMGFMTNPTEDSMMADPSFQNKMVTGIANGIDAFLK